MNVIVCVKRVIDYAVRTRIRVDARWVETEAVKHSMNPFDEIAMEAALRLKSASIVKNIIAVTCGVSGGKSQEVLRTALALGADEAVHIEVPNDNELGQEGNLQPLGVAKLLAAFSKKEQPDLVMMGKQAIDDDSNQTGQLLAGILNWPQATFVSEIKALSSDGKEGFKVAREVDGGLQVLKYKTPFILTTDLRLNEPRYATLQNIMKAKKIPIRQETLESLNVKAKDVFPRLKILKVLEPAKRQAGKKVESVDELIKALKEEAQVL